MRTVCSSKQETTTRTLRSSTIKNKEKVIVIPTTVATAFTIRLVAMLVGREKWYNKKRVVVWQDMQYIILATACSCIDLSKKTREMGRNSLEIGVVIIIREKRKILYTILSINWWWDFCQIVVVVTVKMIDLIWFDLRGEESKRENNYYQWEEDNPIHHSTHWSMTGFLSNWCYCYCQNNRFDSK